MSSMLGKYKIAVDTAVVANGDSIASYLVDSAGNLLTSTLVSGDQALDVNVVQSALPTGAATETTLASVLAELQAMTYADGTAWGAGSIGNMPLAVRQDAAGPLTGVADGDFSPLQVDANGALKVAGSFTVDFSFDYAEDSAHTTGDIGAFTLAVRRDARTSGTSADGDYASFNVNANGEMWVHDADAKAELIAANASLNAIEASVASIDTNVGDIKTEQLAQGVTLDSILTELTDQGTTLDSILADTATIDSQTLSISNTLTALSKAEDAAHSSGDQGIQALAVRKDAQGTNTSADGDYSSLQTWSEGSLKVVDVANGSVLQQRISVTTTAAALPASALANRKTLMIQNAGSSSIFIGSATVTAAGATAGIEVPKGGFMEMEVGPAVAVYAITASGSVNANVLEMA